MAMSSCRWHAITRSWNLSERQQAWKEAAGEQLASQTRPGKVSRGVLEVYVSNSILAQELGFAKKKLLARLQQLQPDEKIRDLRFRVGPLD